MIKSVLILSGGIDSTTLLYRMIDRGWDVYPITFKYGQKHEIEVTAARRTCKMLGLHDRHRIIDIGYVFRQLIKSNLLQGQGEIPKGNYDEDNMKSTVVPNRNMIMLSIAAGYAYSMKASILAYGAHGGDHALYPDTRPEFVNKMKELLNIADYNKLELYVPYMNSTKVDIVKEGLKLGVKFGLTWTCYSPQSNNTPCGKCGSCLERFEAFEENETQDPLDYED